MHTYDMMCIYIYIYMYTHMYIYMHIYITSRELATYCCFMSTLNRSPQ